MISFLLLGFLIGLSHAMEADHLAAVGALSVSGKSSPKRLAFLGASWGMGHTATLFLLSSIVIGFGVVLSDSMAAGLEFMVGILLIGLGVNVFWKLYKSKTHFHIHQHEDGQKHIHAHSHADSQVKHERDSHDHEHGFSLRAFMVGLVHGAAGSAALIALTAAATQNVATALAYVLVFGLGSVLGMALLTYAVSWPVGLSEKRATGVFKIIQGSVACVAIYIGIGVIMETAPVVWSGV